MNALSLTKAGNADIVELEVLIANVGEAEQADLCSAVIAQRRIRICLRDRCTEGGAGNWTRFAFRLLKKLWR